MLFRLETIWSLPTIISSFVLVIIFKKIRRGVFSIKSLTNLILVPVCLADQPGVIPALDGTPGELVAAVPESNPVSRTSEFLQIGTLAEFEPGRVDRVDVTERVSVFINLRSRPSTTYNNSNNKKKKNVNTINYL